MAVFGAPAVMGTVAVRVVSAVMFTYPAFPALALALVLILTLPGIGAPRFEPSRAPLPGVDGHVSAMLSLVQWIGGFFVTSALVAADWGAASRARRDVTLAQLAAERFVLREPGSTTRRALEAAMQENGLLIDCALEIGSREGVWKAVLEGLGIGVVTDFEFVAHPDLKALPISDADITVEYRLACLRDRRQSPKIRAFIDTVLGPGR